MLPEAALGAAWLLAPAGFALGLVHAFEPDHVAAMLGRARGGRAAGRAGLLPAALRGSLPGAAWGLGHTSTVLLVGLLVTVLAVGIPAAVFDGFELAVGAMLIVLGASMYAGRGAFRMSHSHEHSHADGTVHSHPHSHGGGHSHAHRSYLIGCVHGLAGSGGLVAAGAAVLGGASELLAFALVFGAGTVVGMAAASTALAVPLAMSERFARLGAAVRAAAGCATAGMGAFVVHGLAESGRLPGMQ